MSTLIRFILLALLSRFPAVLSARLLARVAHRPLRLLLGLVLQPLLTLVLSRLGAKGFFACRLGAADSGIAPLGGGDERRDRRLRRFAGFRL